MAALVPLLLGKREAYKRKVIPGLIKHKEENSQGCLVIHSCLPVILGLQNVDLLFQGKGVGLPAPRSLTATGSAFLLRTFLSGVFWS